MSGASWPAQFPFPLQASFSMQPEDRRTASSAVGTSFQRGFGGDVCIAECSVRLSPQQAAWFEAWERETLVQGSRWFSFPVWYGGAVHWEQCRFKSRPKASGKNGFWMDYSFALFVRSRSDLMPECLVKVLACLSPCFFFDFDGSLVEVLDILSGVTESTVSSALAGLYGD